MHQGTLNNPHLTWGSRSSAFCWTHARAKHRKASERRSLSLSRNSRVAGTSSTINEMAIMAIMAIWIAHICSRLLTLVQCSAFLWMGHCRLRVPTSSCCNICCTSWSFCLEHCILRTRNQEQPRHWESMGECWAGLQIPGLEVKQHVTTVTTDIGWLLCFKTTSRHRNLPFEILVRGESLVQKWQAKQLPGSHERQCEPHDTYCFPGVSKASLVDACKLPMLLVTKAAVNCRENSLRISSD